MKLTELIKLTEPNVFEILETIQNSFYNKDGTEITELNTRRSVIKEIPIEMLDLLFKKNFIFLEYNNGIYTDSAIEFLSLTKQGIDFWELLRMKL